MNPSSLVPLARNEVRSGEVDFRTVSEEALYQGTALAVPTGWKIDGL